MLFRFDLGHYERFTGRPANRMDSITTGRIYQEIIAKERRGDFLGGTVQVIPHVTDAIKAFILDSNQGLLSIAGRKGFEHVRGDDVHSMADLDAVYANCTGTGEHDWTKKFDTVVFDHFDDIQGIVLDLLADRAAEKDDCREVDQLEQREYGVMGNKLRRYMRKFKRVPKHKILICGESQDFETGRLRPSLVIRPFTSA